MPKKSKRKARLEAEADDDWNDDEMLAAALAEAEADGTAAVKKDKKKKKKKGKGGGSAAAIAEPELEFEDVGQKKGKKKKGKKKKGGGLDARLNEMIELRTGELVELCEQLIVGVSGEKYAEYLTEDKKELLIEEVQLISEWYSENKNEALSDEVFDEKCDELRATFAGLIEMCEEEYAEEHADEIAEEEERQRLAAKEAKLKEMEAQGLTVRAAGSGRGRGRGGGRKMNAKQLQRMKLKQLQKQMAEEKAEQSDDEGKGEDDEDGADEPEEKKSDQHKKQNSDDEDDFFDDSDDSERDSHKKKKQQTPVKKKGASKKKPAKKKLVQNDSESDGWSDDDDDASKSKGKSKSNSPSEQSSAPSSAKKADFSDDSDTESKKRSGPRKRNRGGRKKKKAQAAKAAAAAAAPDPDPKVVEERPPADDEESEVSSKSKKKGKKGQRDGGGKKKKQPLKSPICVVMGHVDTGKTKILDKIRNTAVQDREAGGITQQIGATYLTVDYIREATSSLSEQFKMKYKVPGLLFIDTPGHESFSNLRKRGSSLCDIAVLVVDLMHGLEPQTIESLNMLKSRDAPFVVALNKIDMCYEWKTTPNAHFEATFAQQERATKRDFDNRLGQVRVEFAQNGFNASLYNDKKINFKEDVALIPTSAVTGEGIPDLLLVLVQWTQKFIGTKITLDLEKFECTILEVKKTVGHGATLDVILSNGILRKDDTLVVCGMNGNAIVTKVRALLMPSEASEMRERATYEHADEVFASAGVRISAPDLEHAVAGSHIMLVPRTLDKYPARRREVLEDMKAEVQDEFDQVFSKISKSQRGVWVQASTLGSLEALVGFLHSLKPPVPIVGMSIGDVQKKDVMKASIMLEHQPEFACILAFNVRIQEEARVLADQMHVRIFEAEIIYHLEEMFENYVKEIRSGEATEAKKKAVFPVELEILPAHIIHNRAPIVLGCQVRRGTLRIGTPIVSKRWDPVSKIAAPLYIGNVVSIQKEKKELQRAKVGDKVAVKFEGDDSTRSLQYGRQFDDKDPLISRITRESLDAIKGFYMDEITDDDKLHLKDLKVNYFGFI